MELNAIEIGQDEAKARLAEYEEVLRSERSAEDEALAAGYRAAARGLPVISLTRTIGAGGFRDDGLPKLSVIGAEAQVCHVGWDGADLVFADREEWSIRNVNRGALVNKHSVRVPVAGDDRPRMRGRNSGETIVPLIPPRFRPRPRRLRHCHILWEVEEWRRVAPRDPALLRHIRGDLWAVLAVWDLTELERLVLMQR